jgi:hypothetical protein
VLQDEEPTEQIAKMKTFLMNKLKSEFFVHDR